MKKILYILAAVALTVGCAKNPTDDNNSKKPSETKVELGVKNIGVSASIPGLMPTTQGAPSSRAIGSAMEELVHFGNEDVALYGVCERFSDGGQSWLTADRTINTLEAKVTVNDAVGKIDYGTDVAYYPEGGYLNIYAIYPSGTSYLTIDDKGATVATPPSATITLGTTFATQYDVLHGATEQLTAAQSQRASVTFTHALAQLKFKIYKESADISARVSKITVSGVGKATMGDIRKAEFTLSTDPTDVVSFVAYDNATAKEVTKTTATDAEPIGDPLMIIPGAGSVGKVTIVIDGEEYYSDIPSTWALNQGKKNTVTLRIDKFGVRTENIWQISTWESGTGVDQDLENNGKIIQITTNLENATGSVKAPYTTGTMPSTMDVKVDGYTYKNIAVTMNAGTLTSDKFNSGWLNENPRYVEALTLYDANKNVIFTGKANNATLTNGAKIYIDTEDGGKLKLNSANGRMLGLSMTFGGFGDGTNALPYQVSEPVHLSNMKNLLGLITSKEFNGTKSGGGVFVQSDDIDLSGVAFTPIGQSAAFFGSYDGNYKRIRNINVSTSSHAGLFGWVNKGGSSPKVIIQNVIVESGTIVNNATSASYTGSIVGYLGGGSIMENCSSKASIKGASSGVGGVVGNLAGGSQVLKCANLGTVTSTATNLGGVVGNSASGCVIRNCYNSGAVAFTGTLATANVGGFVGQQLTTSATTTITASYNRSIVNNSATAPTQCGAFLGYVGNGQGAANLVNNYFLTGSYTVGIGLDKSASTIVTTNTIGKTADELKALATTLGNEWEADDVLNPINEGYPVLKWQKNQ